MKKIIVVLSILAQFVIAGTAMGTVVNFSTLGPPTNDPPVSVDITIANNPAGYTASGLTFRYEDFGNTADFALVDPAGIFGTVAGALLFDFVTPATALGFNFSLLEVVLADPQANQVPDALAVLFFSGGIFSDFRTAAADYLAYDPADPTLGFASGAFAYSGPAFDHAELYFWPDAQLFTADSVSYRPVPEPATFVLLALGLLAFGGWRYCGRKYCSTTHR